MLNCLPIFLVLRLTYIFVDFFLFFVLIDRCSSVLLVTKRLTSDLKIISFTT